jgi:trk system potassium uptake protein
MNIKLVTRVVSSLTVIIGIAMLTSVPVSWLMQDPLLATYMLFVSSMITIAVGGTVRYFTRKAQMHFGFREGFGIVTFGWLFASIFGAIPFCLVSNLTWYDAFFETMSGFTTTGASVIGNSLILADGTKLAFGLLDIPNGLIYWRSLTHWFGGMGIVLLSLAILPTLGISAHQLYNAEVPGPTEDQITPRIATSAKILWTVYILLSLIQSVLLWSGGMTIFDAVCTTFGTMATGGFSTQPASLGAYNSAYIDMVTTLFMFLAGANFVLHYKFLRGKPLTHFKDEEFKFYFFIILISSVTIAIYLTGSDIVMTSGIVYANASFWEALRFSTFQVTSIITTTGFATANFNLWPAYCGLLLVVLMFVGGCGGSTGGGIKNSRILLLLKYCISQVERRLFVRSLSNVRLNKQRIDNSILHKTLSFFFIFIGIFILFSLLLCWMGVDDILTATTASIACLGNIGPGLGKVGPDYTFAWMSAPAKLLLAFEMLLGRLELYTVLVIFLPTFWKR